jgi:hypothetical protein
MLQSLLLTGLGGVLGITGTLFASQWQARNAKQVRAEQYSREDRYRLATERINAYTAFYRAAGRARSAMWIHAHAEGGEFDKDFRTEMQAARDNLWDCYTVIGLIGDDGTERRASAVLELVTKVSRDQARFADGQWTELIRAYIRAARLELISAERGHTQGPISPQLGTDHRLDHNDSQQHAIVPDSSN